MLSSYSDGFWSDRLASSEVQAEEGLVGRLDRLASTDEVIVCEDGFRAGRMTPSAWHFAPPPMLSIGQIKDEDHGTRLHGADSPPSRRTRRVVLSHGRQPVDHTDDLGHTLSPAPGRWIFTNRS